MKLSMKIVLVVVGAIVLFVLFIFGASLRLYISQHQGVQMGTATMEHNGSFDEWWSDQEQYYSLVGIDKEEFQSFPFRDGINKGDKLLIAKANYSLARVGMVVYVDDSWLTRIVEKHESYFIGKGDANPGMTQQELNISADQLTGIVVNQLS